jgi:hypothetical protein
VYGETVSNCSCGGCELSKHRGRLIVAPDVPLHCLKRPYADSLLDIQDPSTIGEHRPYNRRAEIDLEERFRQAIAYSKTEMLVGDTLVYISYPPNAGIYDHTGFLLPCGRPFYVHSDKLIDTGSKVFKKLFDTTSQEHFRKEHGFVEDRELPHGIKFVLDLTPPECKSTF